MIKLAFVFFVAMLCLSYFAWRDLIGILFWGFLTIVFMQVIGLFYRGTN